MNGQQRWEHPSTGFLRQAQDDRVGDGILRQAQDERAELPFVVSLSPFVVSLSPFVVSLSNHAER